MGTLIVMVPPAALDRVDELEELLVGVVAVLVGDGRVERQVDRQQAVPLHVVETGVGQIVLRRLSGLPQFAVRRDHDAFAGRPDEIGADLAIFQQVNLSGMVVLDRASGSSCPPDAKISAPLNAITESRIPGAARRHLFVPTRRWLADRNCQTTIHRSACPFSRNSLG